MEIIKNSNQETKNPIQQRAFTFPQDIFSRLNLAPFNPMPMDIVEHDGSFSIHADLPGFKKDQVKATVDAETRTLVIEAAKDESNDRESQDQKGGRYAIRERHVSSVHREIRMPENADTAKISAKFEDGVLDITIARLPEEEKKTGMDIKID